MPIVEADILTKLSHGTGPGDSTAQTDVTDSIGGFMSSTRWASTLLNGSINSSVTSITVDSSAGFPASGNFDIQIDDEILTVTDGHGTTSLTVTRAAQSSTAANHSDNAVVQTDPILWPDLSGDDNAASAVHYRLIFIENTHATLTYQSVKVWVSSQVSGGCDFAIGLSPVGVVDHDSASAQGETPADEDTAPSGVTFSTPTSKATGLSIGNLAPGEVHGVWIRRTANDTGAVNDDGATIRHEGDTAA